MKLIEALKAATKDDLDAIVQRLGELSDEMDQLRTVQRFLQARFEPKPAPVPRAAKSTAHVVADDGEYSANEKRRKIALYILANGPKSQTKLSESLGISRQGRGCLSSLIGHDWFHIDPQGIVSVTAKCENEIRKA